MKYLPSVFLRKRNNGDTQATLATRVWGTSSSARSLIFADGVPLTALIANNNTIGGPRWGLVVAGRDRAHRHDEGPFSAAYAGNSMGAVMEITTRLPKKLEGSIKQTQALQRFDLYGTKRQTSRPSQTNARASATGSASFAFWASGNYQNSNSQPLSYVTSASIPDRHDGWLSPSRTSSAPRPNVLGATGLLHTQMTNGKIKMAYDITPTLRAAYTFGSGGTTATAASIRTSQRAGAADLRRPGGLRERLLRPRSASTRRRRSRCAPTRKQRLGFRARRRRRYRFNNDQQRIPTTRRRAATTLQHGRPRRGAGRHGLVHARPQGHVAAGRSALGAHAELRRALRTLRAQEHDVQHVQLDATAAVARRVFTEGDGKTRDEGAVGAGGLVHHAGSQAHRRRPVRETGAASTASTSAARHAVIAADGDGRSKFSPKAVLAWHASQDWTFTASLAKAYRFATAAELYQLVSTGATFTSPNPNLKPDNVTSAELRAERTFSRGSVQLSLFQDDVHDAIISQFLPLVPDSTTLYSFVSNVDHVRARGAELALRHERRPGQGPRPLGQRDVRRRRRRSRCPAAPAPRAAPDARSASGCRTSRSGAPRVDGDVPPGRALHLHAGRPLQLQALHDARQRRRALQHVPGLLRVVRDGQQGELPRRTRTGARRSAWTICSTGSTSCSTRSRTAPSWWG